MSALGLSLSLSAFSGGVGPPADAAPGGEAGAWLLEDGASGWLMEDGISYWLTEA